MEYDRDKLQSSQPADIADEETQYFLVPENSEATLGSMMQQMIEEMHLLHQDFETKIKYDASKERQVDSLHNELQSYRAGLHFKILRPLVLDLISMHDDLSRLVESVSREEEMISIAQVLKNLESFQITVEEILRRNGIEAYSIEGETFVSGKQRVLQAIETTETSLDKQVARRVRKGFEYDAKVLRPELVMTYRAIAHE
ncbi:MAG: nucleotide exchange factor GrpE [Ktedonobacteraceae bacterium]